jgi:hypothetical protein
MAKFRIGLACSLMLLSGSACRPDLFVPETASAPTARPIASVDELQFKDPEAVSALTAQPIVIVDELQFKDPETGQRFRTLDRCIQGIVDDTWQEKPYYSGGNFYESRWCRGTGTRNECQIASGSSDNRDQQAFILYTLFYSQYYPEVFGLGFYLRWVPESTGWGVSFGFDENGGSVVGEGWGVIFNEYVNPTGPPEATVYLNSTYSYTIYGPENGTHFRQFSDLPLREDLAIYLSGSEAMRDRGLAQNQALAQKVFTAINAHQVNTCDRGPYLGGGIPPQCTPRPLSPEEETEELARAEAYFTEQEQLLRNHHREMYNAWVTTFPFDECWP